MQGHENKPSYAYADAPVTPAREQRFDGPARNLEDMLKGMSDLNARLSRIADRLCGVAPPTGIEKEQTGRSGTIAGVVSRFETIAAGYQSQLGNFNNTIDRLEAL